MTTCKLLLAFMLVSISWNPTFSMQEDHKTDSSWFESRPSFGDHSSDESDGYYEEDAYTITDHQGNEQDWFGAWVYYIYRGRNLRDFLWFYRDPDTGKFSFRLGDTPEKDDSIIVRGNNENIYRFLEIADEYFSDDDLSEN